MQKLQTKKIELISTRFGGTWLNSDTFVNRKTCDFRTFEGDRSNTFPGYTTEIIKYWYFVFLSAIFNNYQCVQLHG